MGDILRTRRLELGLSQPELGAAVGVDSRQIRRYESNQTQPTLLVARALANRLGLTLDQLAGGVGSDLSGEWLSGWQVQDETGAWILVQQPVHALQRGGRVEFNPAPSQEAQFPWHGELTFTNGSAYGLFTAERQDRKPTRGALVASTDQKSRQITGSWVTLGPISRPVLAAPFVLVRPEADVIAILSQHANRS